MKTMWIDKNSLDITVFEHFAYSGVEVAAERYWTYFMAIDYLMHFVVRIFIEDGIITRMSLNYFFFFA